MRLAITDLSFTDLFFTLLVVLGLVQCALVGIPFAGLGSRDRGLAGILEWQNSPFAWLPVDMVFITVANRNRGDLPDLSILLQGGKFNLVQTLAGSPSLEF